MSALMTSALLVAGLLAGLAQGTPEIDSVTLLQAQVQAETQLLKEPAEVQEPADYGLANELACSSKEAVAPKMPAAFIEPAAPVKTLQEHIAAVRLTPEAESGDPPGAGVLRAFLELMIIVIIFDGIRRWRLQKQDAGKPKATNPARQVEAAEEAAWIAMVNAASAGNSENFEKALSSKPSVSRTDTWGCTALHFAAAGGSATITAELLKKGVEVDPLDASDETPLHFAARAGHAPICDLLIGAGANINAVNVQDMTPFVIAGHANQEPACRLLADRGAGVAGLTDEQLPPLVVSQLVRKVFDNIVGIEA